MSLPSALLGSMPPQGRDGPALMGEAVELLKDGSVVEATFMSPYFGVYATVGSARWSATIREFTLGCAVLTNGLGVTPPIMRLTTDTDAMWSLGRATDATSGSAVEHNELVVAIVYSFGDRLQVTGRLVETSAGRLRAVGGHIIRSHCPQRGLDSYVAKVVDPALQGALPAVAATLSWTDPDLLSHRYRGV